MTPLLQAAARRRVRAGFAFVALAAALAAPAARAALFEDDEARKAILDLRQRVDQNITRQTDQSAQIEQMRRSMLDLSNQIEALRGEIAKLRGANEQLARDLADVQQRQKDFAQGTDARLARFEPQMVTVDGKEFNASPEERRAYDDAMALVRKGDFPAAVTAFTAFQKRFPKSGYTESVLFWLGNAQYGKRDYAQAIGTFRSLVTAVPDSPRAPEALLSLANAQLELKDAKGARKTLDDLLRTYPKSEAAQAARERIAALK
ncbi:MAG TPA: tol-pal system protein YbgF [Burkholderiaceae bacterium]|nr:tol-pal system protein YbgF [Burkholderiaceae bacterium]HRP27149.1 tol-pal system protein YbgF [Burkholderiaceae bacterium]